MTGVQTCALPISETILTSLMSRLAEYFGRTEIATDGEDIGATVFRQLVKYIAKIMKKGLEIEPFLNIQTSLVNLALKCSPDNIDNVSGILSACALELEKKGTDLKSNSKIRRIVVNLLSVPVNAFDNILTLLDIEGYTEVLKLLPYAERKKIAFDICCSALDSNEKITSYEHTSKLFELVQPLVKDEEDQPEETMDEEDFEEEQNLIARLVHLFDNEDTDKLFKIYSAVRKQFGLGGVNRIKYTLIPLVFCYLRLVQRINKLRQEDIKVRVKEEKVFQYALEILEVLASQKPTTTLKLYLQCAIAADKCKLEKVVYELMSQAFMIYEEEITDTKQQLGYLTQIITTLQSLVNVGADNYDTLSTKSCQYSSKLLRKTDQCIAAFTCSHLFWPVWEDMCDSAKVLECLQRSLKIVDSCMSSQQQPLFVEILNKYLYHFDQHNEMITVKYLKRLKHLIESNFDDEDDDAKVKQFYENTLAHIVFKKETDPDHYEDM